MNTIKNIRQNRGLKSQRGQGMTEYLIIVALVAIGAIGVYNLYGKTVQKQVAAAATGLAGDNSASTTASTAAKTSATTAVTKSNEAQGLKDFGKNSGDQQ